MKNLPTFLNRYPGELHVVVDIESLATSKDAAITEIGACVIDTHKFPVVIYTVYHSVCIDPNGDTNEDTIKWRKDNNLPWLPWDELNAISIFDPQHISVVLPKFFRWLADQLKVTGKSKLIMWCKGTDFDKVILETAWEYRCYNTNPAIEKTPVPWEYNNFHDLRTLLKVFPQFNIAKELVKHTGLADALQQASQLIKIAEHIAELESFHIRATELGDD